MSEATKTSTKAKADELSSKAKLEVLTQRYGQLRELNEHKNKVIYRIFYLSVVFVGVAIGGYNAVQASIARTTLLIFASLVFLSMLLWTRTYVNSRVEVHEKIKTVYEEIENLGVKFSTSTSGEDLFRNYSRSHRSTRDWWERNRIKDWLLQLYYLALSSAPWVILLAL